MIFPARVLGMSATIQQTDPCYSIPVAGRGTATGQCVRANAARRATWDHVVAQHVRA